jgi:5-methylcytosine-specific restriction enzyme subunit McrC
MKIPVENIYYLLCYAWNKLEERDVVQVQAEGTNDLLDLFAKVLINGTTYLFKKGLDRDYTHFNEDTSRLRGKVLFDPTIKHLLMKKARAHCVYDELSYNILHNQILKSTIRKLINLKELDISLREGLSGIYKRYPMVDDIDIRGRHFRQVKLHRNNYFYHFLLNVCELIHDCILVNEKTGEYKMADFVHDEGRMSTLFEEFVRNFYKKEQSEYDVTRDYIRWELLEPGDHDHFLPRMETDVSLRAKDGSKKIVLETKYYSGGYKVKGKDGIQDRLISYNLYQLFAYLKNLEKLGGYNANVEGILLYASIGEDADMSFTLPRHRLRVKTLNLNQNWRVIHAELLKIIH